MNHDMPHNEEFATGTLVDCPSCGLPAEITDRFTLGGVPEPVEHVKVVCVRRHWYTLPVDMVSLTEPPVERASTSGMTPRR
jgi:hypothetical protein